MNIVERNKELVREWYELIGNAQYEKAKEYVSDDFVFYPMETEKIIGVEAFINLESANMDPFPGFTFKIINIIGEGDWVAVHFTFEGNLPEGCNKYLGLNVNKNHSYHDIMSWIKFDKNGKICEKHAKYNQFFIFKQLEVREILEIDYKIKANSK